MNRWEARQGMHAHLLSMHFSKQEATILHRSSTLAAVRGLDHYMHSTSFSIQ
jgi:hypothetical protein